MEMKILGGKCKCGRVMEFRIMDLKHNKDIIGYLIHSYCKKCKITFIQAIFQGLEKPIQDRDYIIDYGKIGKTIMK